MNTRVKSSLIWQVALGLAATALAVQVNSAAAQESEESIEEIVVTTPAVTSKDARMGREKVEVLEFSRPVSYSDLDLTLHKDVAALKGRIETAAEEVCKELADQNPKLRGPEPACIREAVNSATAKMDAIVAAMN